jgi:hypothetical protein
MEGINNSENNKYNVIIDESIEEDSIIRSEEAIDYMSDIVESQSEA